MILLEKYGKESEIVKAYTKEILDLPTVPNASPKKLCEFGDKLTYCVQALQTVKKLEQVNGAVSMTLDKLPAIRGDLARTDPDWEKWDFAQLSEAIRLWIRRNPVDTSQREREQEQVVKRFPRPTKIYHARREDLKPRGCVYCGEDHRPVECTRITKLSDRSCPSKSVCQRCHKRHHTSICDATHSPSDANHPPTPTRGVALTTNQLGEGLFPVLVVEVNASESNAER